MCKRIRKKGVCLLLAFLLCFSFLPAPAFSVNENSYSNNESLTSQDSTANEETNATQSLSNEEPSDQGSSTSAPSTISEHAPYYLMVTHSLDLNDTHYTYSEVISLAETDLATGSYNLKRHVMEKEGMAPHRIYYLNDESGLVEKETVSIDDFTQAGDPSDGSAYHALQVVIEYQALEGYRAVLSSNSNKVDDPYGIMPMASFEGSNIKDITFVPADVVTIRLNYKYSPTGGLAGIDAAPSQVYQIKVPDVKRNESGAVTSAGTLNATYSVPHFDPNDPSTSALEGFRIVLDPTPLNAYVNDPDLAQKAMDGKLSPDQIKEALNSDAFAVSTSNPNKPVYYWQTQPGGQAPDSYEDYPKNPDYDNNRYSTMYNQSWESARRISGNFEARIDSTPAQEKQGANPLNDPMLTFSLTEEQCIKALNSTDPEVTVNVYYRRNAGFYNVAHWVPRANIPADEIATYKTQYPDYNNDDGAYHRDGLIMVYLEHKQGRVGALTNARPYPQEKEGMLRSFVPQPFVQEEIVTDTTRVDITYDIADSYSLIFLTDGSYIPRQHVDAGDTVTFSAKADTKMSIRKADGTTSAAQDYKNPTRQGYEFAGWKYEVKAIPSDAIERDNDGKFYRSGESGYYTQENGKFYKNVLLTDAGAGNAWTLSKELLGNTTVVQDSNGDKSKIIYLSPIWAPNEASVRVVFWTEDLGGGSNDTKVTLSDSSKSFPYCQNLPDEYLTGTPETVGANFSNVGSFTFMAPTGAKLDLSVANRALASTTGGTFKATGETGSNADPKDLTNLINSMFSARMPNENVSTSDSINTSAFYHAYQVDGETQTTYTVAPDGSTVINVYFARNVYTLNFSYYGTITAGSGKGTGPSFSGQPGLVVATNTIGYTLSGGEDGYDYQYWDEKSNRWMNRWEQVKDPDNPAWTVPRTVTIQAKYNADLRDAWPCTNNETIPLTLQTDDSSEGRQSTAVFVSWAATAGPFSQAYRNLYQEGKNGESTIMGAYRAMSADIIADPSKPYVDAGNQGTPHNLYAYWWNQALSYYRFNTCYEIPELTWGTLKGKLDANGGVKTVDIRAKVPALNFDLPVATGGWKVLDNPLYGGTQNNINDSEAERRDTTYLVPIGGDLRSYFDDYAGELIRYDESGNESDTGTYYAVRRISTEDSSKIYAIARHTMASSSNFIEAQKPSAETHMTPMKVTYQVNGEPTAREVSMDHSSRVWDDWGRTMTPVNDTVKGFVQVGTPSAPYDLYYYYDRERFDIHYMVPAKDSVSGEYEYGTRRAIFGESLAKYRVDLSPADKGKYSDDATTYPWTAVDNATTPGSLNLNDASLNSAGHTAIVPDSAQGSRGTWGFKDWHLDRAGDVSADNIWNTHVSGNLRVFALWEPPQYQVKFDFNGGTYNGSSTFDIQKVTANVGYTSSGNPIPSPTKPGYDFAGWTWHESTATTGEPVAGGEIDFNFEKPITQDLVLTANWVSNAKQTYNYKIWYLTDDANATQAEKPDNATGEWLEGNDWGTPHPDANHSSFTHVLGCQYFSAQELPEKTILSLVAESIPGYMPVSVSTALPLKREQGTNAANTENVAYFYYRKTPVKTYKIRYQLFDKSGEDGIVPHLTTESSAADVAFFSPNAQAWKDLKASGYQLVQMDEHGNTKWNGGQPIPAQSYLDLSEFIDARNREFIDMNRGEEALITFKVAPIPYSIDYHVGTLSGGEENDALKAAMQDALDKLKGDDLRGSAATRLNPTNYKVTDFADNYHMTLTNPDPVQDPNDPEETWEFVGWSLGPGTTTQTRSAGENYPQLELEQSVGDLVFLANWKKVGSDDPDDPNDPNSPSNEQNDPTNSSNHQGTNGTDASSDDEGSNLPWTGEANVIALVGVGICALVVLALMCTKNRTRQKRHDS